MTKVNTATIDDTILSQVNGARLKDNEWMRFEATRLASFSSWPRESAVYPTRLAKAGFFYKGHGDEVTCFSCGCHVTDWDRRGDPFEEHRRLSPSCAFIRGNDVTNKPLEPREQWSSQTLRELLTSLKRPQLATSETSHSSLPFLYSNQNEKEKGSLTLKIPKETNRGRHLSGPGSPDRLTPAEKEALMRSKDTRRRNSLRRQTSRTMEGSNVSSSAVTGSPQTSGMGASSANPGPMMYEKNRLITFRAWPMRSVLNPKELAAAGFYFVGEGDKVKCAFCEGEIVDWAPGDDPRDEHRIYFGTRCPFIRGEPSENVPLDVTSGEWTVTQAHSVPRPPRPLNPNMTLKSDRVLTYRNWPSDKRQTPNQLAEAGFYHTGAQDQVRCFHCDGGLRNWKPEDEPWTEHARWFPDCQFVIQNKGRRFIEEAKQNNNITVQTTHAGNETSSETGVAAKGQGTRKGSGNFDRRLVTAQMATRQIQLVLDMGFQRHLVQAAIEERLRTTGQAFPSAESLVEVLMTSSGQEAPTGAVSSPSGGQAGTTEGHAGEPRDKAGSPSNVTARDRREPSSPSNQKVTSVKEIQGGTDIEKENRRLRDERECKVCMDRPSDIVFLPCRHLVACHECSLALRKCPVCRSPIRGSVRTYIS